VINGGIGTQTDAMKRATADTRGVSHFRSPNAMSLFSWWEDGELRTRFEGPLHRDGSAPDELVDLMHPFAPFALVVPGVAVSGNERIEAGDVSLWVRAEAVEETLR
jgi:hypothetical protein